MLERLRRHDLVFVDPDVWAARLCDYPELRAVDLVVEWADAGRPLVVRRRSADDPDGDLALGLPLPPAYGKRRVAVSLDPAGALSAGHFPTLRAAQVSAPVRWLPSIKALLVLAAEVQIEPLVFGSLAWSILTRLDYVVPTSDLDLLWPLNVGANAAALLDGLARIASTSPMRVDGEIIDGDGRGVQWQELASDRSEVLAKGLLSIALVAPSDFLRLRVAE
ncbi:malonate decarboxylase holo-[acyl-carrier-protein] synthase [Lichenifustis flavocetrariae]|uniref:Malonate decarboxylase holo-[acyl-carrier-protein] synthase n=1 Tax=Lichenifustis flavocetrariae TaxID=2949735 RepID=A0AA41Z1X5_9HYPH|nr:malonate decarboxylase holo-[acyl-carrier-protein] synthase [Lichenifustis flavocetrariae]MCW6512219.1 malonate decarboxylase holo-[acyl-carrier-protein] synthase [Lichenifustis flavocetrariae]